MISRAKGLLLLLISTFPTAIWGSAINASVHCEPDYLPHLIEGSVFTLLCNVTHLREQNEALLNVINLEVFSANIYVADCLNSTKTVVISDDTWESSYLLSTPIMAKFIGRTEICFKVADEFTTDTYELSYKLPLAVLRREGKLQLIFTITVTVMVVINTFIMGMQLDWRMIIAILRKPVAPLIGLACQFFCMPLLAFLWGLLMLHHSANLQLGLFAIGCAPGGGNSNFWTILLGGNIDLSVTMTFISNFVALAMMPFWLFTLGKVITAGTPIVIPFANIIFSLLGLIIPVIGGILLKHFHPHLEESAKRAIKITSVVVILVVVIFGTYANFYIYLLMTWRTVLCGMLLPWSGFIVGFTAAYGCRQSVKNAITVAVETGIQNAGIAIILITFSLEQPDSDLTLVMPISVLIFTPIPLCCCLIVKTIRGYNQKLSESDQSSHQNSVKFENDEDVIFAQDSNYSADNPNFTSHI